ncbi:PspA/IM30 family protein [Corynebacterium uterequi]|uniref:Phage shock protein A (PspA) family protein n=1 Tax=Corynebacterium uterequi TaxID=1072256 RepID=A0A0G3HFR7_9CORY|nr:PspA/IM30 family protein [Corynebacterium uterequi]AKK12124.1 phage shock protein A (PspA) family protein [Corynebacterium uterequi]
MANPFRKGWKYLMSSFDYKIDANADPKVQVQQAVDAAKSQHREISQQAASIIGNAKQLEMQIDRLVKSQADHQQKARTALEAADQAAAAGDAAKAQQYTNTAEVIASQLVAVENELANTKRMYEQAAHAAEQAKQQQQQSEARLSAQLAEADKLLAQADQAAMQEQSAKAMDQLNQFGGQDDSVPNLDAVRDKIERRYADALGAQELTQNTVTDRMAEIASAGTDIAAASKLAEIRASMGANKPAPELEAPTPEPAEDSETEAIVDAEPVDGPADGGSSADGGERR